MYRKTLDELLEMLESYEDVLSKGFIDEIKPCRDNLDELKKKIDKEYEKASASSFSSQMFEFHRERRRFIARLLYTIQCKIFSLKKQT
ncbi:MAG TPA: hypothetical protein PKU93_00505 [Candidatus Pacearchaeota archaeon]|nr:hypothetical protein [Candidatus Pacearchaeota archaeon]